MISFRIVEYDGVGRYTEYMFKHKRNKVDPDKRVNEADILPYDSLISNRGTGESNLYLQRSQGTNSGLELGVDPSQQFNAPPWLSDDVRTVADERKIVYGNEDAAKERGELTSRSGLSRDDGHSEYGGANIFSRIKRRKEEKENLLGSRNHKTRNRRTFLASRIYK